MNIEENNFFNSYKLSDDIIKSLEVLGYRTPTRIQQSVIPPMLSGSSVLIKAPTGSGETAAFRIPVYEHAVWGEDLPQVLILRPTRESMEQVRDELFLTKRLKCLKVAAVYGGFPIDKQIRTLKQKSHMIMGIPGCLMDHIRRETLELNEAGRVVIDEADLILDMELADEVEEILSELPQDAGISPFSVALKPEVCQLTDGFVQNAITVTCDAQPEEEAAIRQLFYGTASEDKYGTFIRVLKLENPDNTITFCGTREMVNVLLQKLRRDRIFYGMPHGEMEQKGRLKTINAFRRGGLKFLVATDVIIGGIDFKDIIHVINYDFPAGRETYVHRTGRTGRNGKTRTAVNLACGSDRRMLKIVKEYIGRTSYMEEAPIPEYDREETFRESQHVKIRLEDQDGNGFNRGIMRLAIGRGRKSKIRANDIMTIICTIGGMDMTGIGIIDIRDSLSYVEILNQKGEMVLGTLKDKTLKDKVGKVESVKVQGLI